MKYKRKTEEEIKLLKRHQFKKAFNPKIPLLLGAGSVPLIFLSISFLPSRFSNPVGMSFESLIFSVAAGIVLFLLTYFTQILRRRTDFDEPYFGICNKCQKTSHDGKTKCKCGGIFEPQEYYEAEK